MTVRYRLGCHLEYQIKTPTAFIFNLEVAKLMRHIDLTESLVLTPNRPLRGYTVPDNKNRYFGIEADPGPLSVKYEAEVTLDVFRADPSTIAETPVAALPLDIIPFLLPSRFVSSDRLAAFAEKEFGEMPKGHQRVSAICNWIYDTLDYQRGSSDEFTTADETLLMRAGVCRDFAHLGIAFCRALDIPARFVSCYAYGLEPNDFHAVFEAYLDGRWWLFDATRQANLDGLVRIGVGRDAAEIAFAWPFGEMEAGPIKITIDHADGSTELPGRTTDAISTEDPRPMVGVHKGRDEALKGDAPMNDSETVQHLAKTHGLSKDAVRTVLDALRRGGGRMAQFSHSDFGGMSQWSSGGMTMIGDMGNDAKKAKLNALATDLASYLDSDEGSKSTQTRERKAAARATEGKKPAASWWPSDLGSPSSTGAQNDMRYAVFPDTRRLAVDDGKKVRVYDTGDHRISGVAQSQGNDKTLTFSGQDGRVDLSSLKPIEG